MIDNGWLIGTAGKKTFKTPTLKGVPTIQPEKLTGRDNAICPSVMRLLIRLVVKDSGNQQECSKECSLAP